MSVIFVSEPSHRSEPRVISALEGAGNHLRTVGRAQAFLPGSSPGWFQIEAGFIKRLDKRTNLVCWVGLLHQFDPIAVTSLANLVERLTGQPIIALSDSDLGLPQKPELTHARGHDATFVPINLVRIEKRMPKSIIAEAFRRATWLVNSAGYTMPRLELPDPSLEEVVWCFRGGKLYHINPNCADTPTGGEMFPIYIEDASRIGRVGCCSCRTSGCHPAMLPELERRWIELQAQGREEIASRQGLKRACPVHPAPGYHVPKRTTIR